MKSYTKVSPRFWTGNVGLRLRGHLVALVLALYLITCEHANMIGLCRLPIAYICDDLGLPEDKVRDALAMLVDLGFCKYDEDTQCVWVVELLRHELDGRDLNPDDNRVKAIGRILDDHAVSDLVREFREHYGVQAPSEAPAKGLRSPHRSQQQQQQQQPQQQKQQQEEAALPPDDLPLKVWEAYLSARSVCGANGSPDADWLKLVVADTTYHSLDLARELTLFGEYWSDRPKPPTSFKRAVRSWLRKAVEIDRERRSRVGHDASTLPELT